MNNIELYCRLAQCRTIRSGQTFKASWDNYALGTLTVLLPKDIVDGNIGTGALQINAAAVTTLSKHLLQKGDVIIVNKGTRFNTLLYKGEPQKVVVTTAFYVITPGKKLLPGYLYWYLGQPEAREYFALNAKGSVIPGINKTVLQELPLPLIPLEEQQYICQLADAACREQDLIAEWLKKKAELTECYIWEHINRHLS